MTELKVWSIGDYGLEDFLVRGTYAVDRAQGELLRWLLEEAHTQDLVDEPLAIEDALKIIRRRHTRVGYWRWLRCYCGAGHRVDLESVDAPGRGVFPGVYFAA